MKNGSQHDPRSAPTSEPFAEVVDQPGWFGQTWSRVGRAWRWVRRKHEPISEGIETAGRGWTRAARTAARNGQSLAKMGDVIERNGAILANGRGRARRIGRNLVAFGGGLPKFGTWLTKTGRSWAPLGESIEDIGEHIGELDIAPLLPEEPPERLTEPERVRTLPPARPAKGELPEAAPRTVPKRSKPSTRKAGKAPQQNQRRRVTPQPTPPPETDQELPADVQKAIASLGKRPRSERLRDVIEAICRSREWTSVAELSDFLGVSEKTLRSRHVPQMIKQGRLVRRYPNRSRHRGQAYRTLTETPTSR